MKLGNIKKNIKLSIDSMVIVTKNVENLCCFIFCFTFKMHGVPLAVPVYARSPSRWKMLQGSKMSAKLHHQSSARICTRVVGVSA